MAFDPERELSFSLADGTPLCVRSIRPEDRDFITEAFRRLSPESRYFRFWTRVRELNPRLIEEICSPDQKDHVAWVARHQTRDDIPGVGGASFWRLKEDATAAEVSFTVADEFQGRGVATLLLAVLWEHAVSLGITRLVGHVLHENVNMRAWWDALGATEQEAPRHWLTTLVLDESLLEDNSAGNSLRARLTQVRAWMNEENVLKD
jgi:RimJ/RimL family protein N-acetyltransferase